MRHNHAPAPTLHVVRGLEELALEHEFLQPLQRELTELHQAEVVVRPIHVIL